MDRIGESWDLLLLDLATMRADLDAAAAADRIASANGNIRLTAIDTYDSVIRIILPAVPPYIQGSKTAMREVLRNYLDETGSAITEDVIAVFNEVYNAPETAPLTPDGRPLIDASEPTPDPEEDVAPDYSIPDADDLALPGGDGVERAAREYGVAPDDIREMMQRYPGMSAEQAAQLIKGLLLASPTGLNSWYLVPPPGGPGGDITTSAFGELPDRPLEPGTSGKTRVEYNAQTGSLYLVEPNGTVVPLDLAQTLYYDPRTNRTYVRNTDGNFTLLDPGRLTTWYDPDRNETVLLYSAGPNEPAFRSRMISFQGNNTRSDLPVTNAPGGFVTIPNPFNRTHIRGLYERYLQVITRQPIQDNYLPYDPSQPPRSRRRPDQAGSEIEFVEQQQYMNNAPIQEQSERRSFMSAFFNMLLQTPQGRAAINRAFGLNNPNMEVVLYESGVRVQGSGPSAQTRIFITWQQLGAWLNSSVGSNPTQFFDTVIRPARSNLSGPVDQSLPGQLASAFASGGVSGVLSLLWDSFQSGPESEELDVGVNINNSIFYELSLSRNSPTSGGGLVFDTTSPSNYRLNVRLNEATGRYVLMADLEVKVTIQSEANIGPFQGRLIEYPGGRGGYGIIPAGTEFTAEEVSAMEFGIRNPAFFSDEGQPSSQNRPLFRWWEPLPVPDATVRPATDFMRFIRFAPALDGSRLLRFDIGAGVAGSLFTGGVPTLHSMEGGFVFKFYVRPGQDGVVEPSEVEEGFSPETQLQPRTYVDPVTGETYVIYERLSLPGNDQSNLPGNGGSVIADLEPFPAALFPDGQSGGLVAYAVDDNGTSDNDGSNPRLVDLWPDLNPLQESALGLGNTRPSQLTGPVRQFGDAYKQVFRDEFNRLTQSGVDFAAAVAQADALAGDTAYAFFNLNYVDDYFAGYGPTAQPILDEIRQLSPDAQQTFLMLIASGKSLTEAAEAVRSPEQDTSSSGIDRETLDALVTQGVVGILNGLGPDAQKAAGWIKAVYGTGTAVADLTSSRPVDDLEVVTGGIANLLTSIPNLPPVAKKIGEVMQAALTFDDSLDAVRNLDDAISSLQSAAAQGELQGLDTGLFRFESYADLVQAGIGLLTPFLDAQGQKVAGDISKAVSIVENSRRLFSSSNEIVTSGRGLITPGEVGLVKASSAFAIIGLAMSFSSDKTVQQIGSGISAASAVTAAIAAGTAVPIIGAVVAVLSFAFGLFGSRKPDRIPLGEVVGNQQGAIADAEFEVDDADFNYTVDGVDLRKVPLNAVSYEVVRIDGYELRTQRESRNSAEEWTAVELDAPLYRVVAHYGWSQLNPNTTGSGASVVLTLSQSELNQLRRLTAREDAQPLDADQAASLHEWGIERWASGDKRAVVSEVELTGRATAESARLLAFFQNQIGKTESYEMFGRSFTRTNPDFEAVFIQENSSIGLTRYGDYNSDGILDMMLDRSDIRDGKGDKYYDGDDGATIKLLSANGGVIETIVADSPEDARLVASFNGAYGLYNMIAADSDLLREFSRKPDASLTEIAKFIRDNPEATQVRTFDQPDANFDMLDYLKFNWDELVPVFQANGVTDEAKLAKFKADVETAWTDREEGQAADLPWLSRRLETALLKDYVHNGFGDRRIADAYQVYDLDAPAGAPRQYLYGHNTDRGTLYRGDVTVYDIDDSAPGRQPRRERWEHEIIDGTMEVRRRDYFEGAEFDANGLYIPGTGRPDGRWDAVESERYDGTEVDGPAGTEGDDRLIGSERSERIIAGAGNDLVRGGGGNDTIYGDAGNDRLYGGRGNDNIDGGAGNDRIYGGAGDDVLIDLSGRDRLFGGNGNDTIRVGDGNDIAWGGRGDDTLVNLFGNNTQLFGNQGADTLTNQGGDNVLLDGGIGADQLTTNGGSNVTLLGGTGDDSLAATDAARVSMSGGAGNDSFTIGRSEIVTAEGGRGDDSFEVDRSRRVTLNGGAGDNSYFVAGSQDVRIADGAGNSLAVLGDVRNATVSLGAGSDALIAGTPALAGDTPQEAGAPGSTVSGSRFDLGAGGDLAQLIGNNNRLSAGNGADDVSMAGRNNTVSTGNGGDRLSVGALPADDRAAGAPLPNTVGGTFTTGGGTDTVGLGVNVSDLAPRDTGRIMTAAQSGPLETAADAAQLIGAVNTAIGGLGQGDLTSGSVRNTTIDTGNAGDLVIVGPVQQPVTAADDTPQLAPAPIIISGNRINTGMGNDVLVVAPPPPPPAPDLIAQLTAARDNAQTALNDANAVLAPFQARLSAARTAVDNARAAAAPFSQAAAGAAAGLAAAQANLSTAQTTQAKAAWQPAIGAVNTVLERMNVWRTHNQIGMSGGNWEAEFDFLQRNANWLERAVGNGNFGNAAQAFRNIMNGEAGQGEGALALLRRIENRADRAGLTAMTNAANNWQTWLPQRNAEPEVTAILAGTVASIEPYVQAVDVAADAKKAADEAADPFNRAVADAQAALDALNNPASQFGAEHEATLAAVINAQNALSTAQAQLDAAQAAPPTAAIVTGNTFNLGAGNDIALLGIGTGNTVNGQGGNDRIVIAGGNRADGGSGNDVLIAQGDSGARLIGGAGNDRIVGSAGNDALLGGAGNDRYVLSAGTDRIRDGQGANSIVLAEGTLGRLDVKQNRDGSWMIRDRVTGGVTTYFGDGDTTTLIIAQTGRQLSLAEASRLT
jgi:Ca2+-binding RTX toxin-like protein